MIVDAFRWHEVRWLRKVFEFTRVIREGHRQITILQSLPILSKVLILIFGTIMIPFNLALTFSILLTLVFTIIGTFLCLRWFAMFVTKDPNKGDMKVPTFYATEPKWETFGDGVPRLICMPVFGGVFGGIHCAGWFFDFPSSAEAVLWWVSSAVLTGVAFLLPILFTLVAALFQKFKRTDQRVYLMYAALSIFVIVYIVSRLLLIVEALFSLRHVTPGMLALVRWTSFIPHI